ncbi:MAG: hypothetical protein GWO81_03845, partial [Verrucomicrobia bacterium]|nr:hypothetical protein [Verrucomicrobiota bacterium]
VFRDVPLQRFSEYDHHYIEVWISKFRERERQSLYRIEMGGCEPVCDDYHGRGSRYIIDRSGAVVVMPGYWYGRCGWKLRNCDTRGFRREVQIYENNGNRVVIVTRP